MPQYPGAASVIDQPIYDTVQLAIAAGVQQVNLFTIPFNGALTAALNKTWADTNLVQAGRLEKGNSLEIKSIGFTIRDTARGGAIVTKADYDAIMRTGHMNLMIGGVTWYRAPLIAIGPGSAETNYFSNIAAAATEFKATHGVIAVQNQVWLENPIMLQDQESIQCDIEVTGVAAVTDISVFLGGTLTRPVR